MGRSILIVMGGTFGRIVSQSKRYAECVTGYKHIFVETQVMKEQLASVGVANVSVFPNCRLRPKDPYIASKPSDRLKCVFFSKICREKGVDIILTAAKKMTSVDFDFWGSIDAPYKNEFLYDAEVLPNVKYCGIFTGETSRVYERLNQYDVLLFPTRCKTEGVPGILVESKIAGVPAIASDVAYNADIIENGVTGTILLKNDAQELVKAIEAYANNYAMLCTQKAAASVSAERYYIDTYLPIIITRLTSDGDAKQS